MNTNVLHHCGERLLDGARTWGAVEARPGRFGITHYRLVVYPPGLSRSEHRWLRLWRGWPMWGGLLWLACVITLTASMQRWPAIGLATAVFAGTGVVTAVRAGDARARVHVLCATTMAGYDDPGNLTSRDRLVNLAGVMIVADDRLAAGELSAVDHELIWWHIYDQVAAESAAARRAA